MKKLLAFFLVLALQSAFAHGDQKGQAQHAGSQFKVDELVILPHPGRVIKAYAKELGVTQEEQQRIEKEVKAKIVPHFQERIRKAYTIEQKVKRAVNKGKTSKDLKTDLDTIAKLKIEAIDYRIQALNKFREIVGEEKWQKIVNYKKQTHCCSQTQTKTK